MRALRAGIRVPLIPAGFAYAGPPEKPVSIVLRIGEPRCIENPRARAGIASYVETSVRELSR
jgi:hypothetical protein